MSQCEDCREDAAPSDYVCRSCRERRDEDRYDRDQENASAKVDGDAPGPRGVMWGDE